MVGPAPDLPVPGDVPDVDVGVAGRGEQTLGYSLGHGSGTDKTNLHLVAKNLLQQEHFLLMKENV